MANKLVAERITAVGVAGVVFHVAEVMFGGQQAFSGEAPRRLAQCMCMYVGMYVCM